MTTPSPMLGVLCRGCGTPLLAIDAACPACGATLPDDGSRLRLARHRGRLLRALGELRAILAYHLGLGASTRHGPLIVVGFLGLLIVPPLVAVGSFAVLLLGGHEWWAVGAALSAIVLQGLGFVSALAITYFLATRLQDRSRRRARACAVALVATTPARCANCGRYSASLALGVPCTLPCAWCDAALVAGDLETGIRAAAAALEAQRAALGPGPYARSRRRGRSAARSVDVPLAGFEMRAGLICGALDDTTLWSGHDAARRGTFVRIEASLATGLSGACWLVRRAGEARLREAAAEWGHALPTRNVASPVPGVRAYADPGVELPDLEAVRTAAARLDPNECLLLEPAGLAVWRHLPSLLMRAWAPLLRHHDALAVLAEALRSGPRQGPGRSFLVGTAPST